MEAGLEEDGFKIWGININNLHYTDVITIIAEHADSLQTLVMKIKEHSEKSGIKNKYKEDQMNNKKYSY